MDYPRKTLCLSGPFKSFTATPREVACHVTTRAHAIPLLFLGAILARCTIFALNEV